MNLKMPVKGIYVGNIRVTLSDAKENNTTAKLTSVTSYLQFGSEMLAIEWRQRQLITQKKDCLLRNNPS